MEKVPHQSIGWRFFALLIVGVLWVVISVRDILPAPDFGWNGAKTVYWLFAPLGLVGYAFGFRPFGETFWRFYAVIFTIEISLRSLRVIGGGHPVWLVAIVFGAITLLCLALLRYANLVGGGNRNSVAKAFE